MIRQGWYFTWAMSLAFFVFLLSFAIARSDTNSTLTYFNDPKCTFENGGSSNEKMKILIGNPLFLFSHSAFQEAIAQVLARKGKAEVHLLMPYLVREMPQPVYEPCCDGMWTDRTRPCMYLIDTDERISEKILDFQTKLNPFTGIKNMFRDGSLDSWSEMGAEACKELLANEKLLYTLRAQRYDVAMSEVWDLCAFGIFHHVGVKTTLATDAIGLFLSAASMYGIPSPSSFVTNMAAASINGLDMSFWERANNLYFNAIETFQTQPYAVALHQPLFDGLSIGGFPRLEQLMKQTSLIFVNQYEMFDLPRPLSPKVVFIGGIMDEWEPPEHIKQRSVEEYGKLMHKVHGKMLVWVSTGTIADISQMPLEWMDALLDMFSTHANLTFIVKIRDGPNKDKLATTPNVELMPFVAQKLLLGKARVMQAKYHLG